MNEFYQDLLSPLMYYWVQLHKGVHVCTNSCKLCLTHDSIYGVIYFHENKMVELMIKDKNTNHHLFDLCFELYDIKTALQQFHQFFHYLKHPQLLQPVQQDKKHVCKILLAGSGLTTEYFANALQLLVDQKKLGVFIEARNYHEIERLIDHYDLILLAPQLAYMCDTYFQKYGDKIKMIDALDFATCHFEAIIEKVIQ